MALIHNTTSTQSFVPGTGIPMSPGQGEYEAKRSYNLKNQGIFGEGVDEMFLTIDAFRLGGYDEEERNTLTKTLQNLILQGKINRKAANYFTDLFKTFPNPGESGREAIDRVARESLNPYGTAQQLGNIMRKSTSPLPVNFSSVQEAIKTMSPQSGALIGTKGGQNIAKQGRPSGFRS